MTLQSTSRAKERILLFGREGTGKTYAWTTIAHWYRSTNTPGMFYVLDTDQTADRSADGYEGFDDNVAVTDGATWRNYMSFVDTAHGTASPEDFLVVDSIDKAWESVQNYFIERVHGKEADEWFLEFREAGKSGHPLAGEYGINWTVINKLYSGWMGRILRFPGHVLCCSPSDQITVPDRTGSGGDSKDILETYGRLGVKPKGQKLLGHQFHSVLLMTTRRDGWAITTAKDRSRERLDNAPMSDFVLNYLKPVGKWEI